MIYRNVFSFDEESFRAYYELHLRPHDKGTGKACISMGIGYGFVFGIMTVAAFGVIVFQTPLIFMGGLNIAALDEFLSFLVCAALFCFSVWMVGYGVFLLRRPRKPKWDNDSWRAKTEKCFRCMKAGPTISPVSLGVESYMNLLYLFIVLPAATYEWGEEPRFFAVFPGLKPRHAKELIDPEQSCVPYEVSFEARFFNDRIEKGSHGEVFCDGYDEVYDIVEDMRFPNLAIIRSVNEGELVIRKDAFGDDSWEKVKRFIERRKNESKVSLFKRKKA